MNKPLCFVLMPFGPKFTGSGVKIDFDDIYNDFIKPAITESGLEPLRADEEQVGGIIHKPMLERLVLCEYAVVDLSTSNANVFYELGLRHAIKKFSTLLIYAEGLEQLPFDVVPLRALPYLLGSDGKVSNVSYSQNILTKRLNEARNAMIDSPVFQLLENFPDIQHHKTDVFRDRVKYSEKTKKNLSVARKQGVEAIRQIESELGSIENIEAGVVIDLFLSYRAAKAWDDMISLTAKMQSPLAATVMIQEQLGLALNRADRGDEAEQVLTELIAKRGPSSETYGILGRVYKDRWENAVRAGDDLLAKGLLAKAVDAYLKGFESDWRDAYPGINAVTLMEISEPPDLRRNELIPIVQYAVERRIVQGQPDYWDYATRLELAVLGNNMDGASAALSDALANQRESWESETTGRNIRLIRQARESRGMDVDFLISIEDALTKISG